MFNSIFGTKFKADNAFKNRGDPHIVTMVTMVTNLQKQIDILGERNDDLCDLFDLMLHHLNLTDIATPAEPAKRKLVPATNGIPDPLFKEKQNEKT